MLLLLFSVFGSASIYRFPGARVKMRRCIGYLGHPFVKLTTLAFINLLFIFVKWYSAIAVAGQCFSCTRENEKPRVYLQHTLKEAMQRLHGRPAKDLFIHDIVSWMHLVHQQYYPVRCPDSGSLSVVMVEPTNSRNSDDFVPCLMRGKRCSARFRSLLLNPLMRSCLVEVRHILIEHAARAASRGRSTHGQGILVTYSSSSAHRPHWLVVHDRAF